MKLPAFVLFLTVFLLIYLSVNLYIFFRGRKIVQEWPFLKWPYTIMFTLIAASFLIGRVIEKDGVSQLTDIFIWIGSYWFAFMLYFFITAFFIDIVRFTNRYLNFIPEKMKTTYNSNRHFIVVTVIAVVSLTVIAGSINASSPMIKEIQVKINSSKTINKNFRIAFISDIHLGRIISNSRLEKLVNMVNSLNADIILLGGDIVDEDLRPVIENRLGKTLAELKSVHGTYAVTGNHEYIGGSEEAVKYLSGYGITFLRDKTVKIDNRLYVAGREDRSITRFTENKRTSLKTILKGIDKKFPVILLDHQPVGIDEVKKENIDLMLCGHTHDGQLWPINYIIKMIFDASYGLYSFDKTQVYVSNGFGTWGPPVRIGNRPEIVLIELTSTEKK